MFLCVPWFFFFFWAFAFEKQTKSTSVSPFGWLSVGERLSPINPAIDPRGPLKPFMGWGYGVCKLTNFPIRDLLVSFSGAHNFLLPLVTVQYCKFKGATVVNCSTPFCSQQPWGIQVSWFPVRVPSEARKKPVSQAALCKSKWKLLPSPFPQRSYELGAFSQ